MRGPKVGRDHYRWQEQLGIGVRQGWGIVDQGTLDGVDLTKLDENGKTMLHVAVEKKTN
jgi:hypothetical protein